MASECVAAPTHGDGPSNHALPTLSPVLDWSLSPGDGLNPHGCPVATRQLN